MASTGNVRRCNERLHNSQIFERDSSHVPRFAPEGVTPSPRVLAGVHLVVKWEGGQKGCAIPSPDGHRQNREFDFEAVRIGRLPAYSPRTVTGNQRNSLT